ncbi:MAG: DinB family protein [Terriglobia bacterium]|nr:DinB family protein [Terriglobia bacterium]
MSTYSFLVDTYETEILKTVETWDTFAEEAMNFRPAPKSRTVLEQLEHQLKSEGAWMRDMLGIDVGEILPSEYTKIAFIEKYRTDASRRLEILRRKPDSWWEETVNFFDVPRSRAWVMVRRMNHSTHHRGQLVVYLRLLEQRVTSVYGPTADTDGKVVYRFE